MFENCSAMVICSDDQQSIKRLEVDEETQKNICKFFSLAVNEMVTGKEKIEFDGSYKPGQDEFLSIDNFQLPDEIKDAIRDPLGVSAYEKVNGEYPSIKAIFVGKCTEEGENESFKVAFQRFRKEQYISTHNINLFWSQNTFRREKEFGISIADTIDCYYANDDLQFVSFYFARQIFDLSVYYRSATNQEVAAFTSNDKLSFENSEAFEQMANTSIRRKIAMINDSKVLSNYDVAEIVQIAKTTGIELTVQDEKIVIPNDKEQIKLILGFLDEEAYKGPFSQIVFLVNSKRQAPKK